MPTLRIDPKSTQVTFTQSKANLSWTPAISESNSLELVVGGNTGGDLVSQNPQWSVVSPLGTKQVPKGVLFVPQSGAERYGNIKVSSDVPAGTYRATWTVTAMVLGKPQTATAFHDVIVERKGTGPDPVPPGPTDSRKRINLRANGLKIIGRGKAIKGNGGGGIPVPPSPVVNGNGGGGN